MITDNVNMRSMMYALYKIVKDSNDQVIDAVVVEANSKYCSYYKVDGDPAGVHRSDILKDSMQFACEYIKRAIDTGKTQVANYYEDALGELSVIFEPVDDEHVSICTFDASMVMHENVLKEKYARVKAICFQLMDCIIWQWDVKKRVCYSSDAINIQDFEKYGLRIDGETGRLVWSFDGMMGCIYEDDRENFSRDLTQYLDEPTVRFVKEFRIYVNDEIKTCELRCCVDSYDNDGKPATFIGVTRII